MPDLVEKAQSGDMEAFGVLIERYKDMVYGTSYAILGDFHDAQDASQDTFVKAWQRLGSLEHCASFPGWLCRIARNHSLDRLRCSRRTTGVIDDAARAMSDPGTKDPRQRAEQRELQEAVLAAIRSLSEANRLATTLFYIDGYSIEEVSKFLEVPPGTVKRRLHDARTKLRERMVEMVEETFKNNPLPEEFARGTLQKIGDFACLELLGTGGLGSVFKCQHPVMKHKVAITIAAFNRPDTRNAFQKSYEALSKLNHPGFVKVFSLGQHEGRHYMVSELLEGYSLKGWLDDHGPRAFWGILQIMARVADAVNHAHSRNVVVGCLRPENIIILHDGAVVLCDAGEDRYVKRDDIWRMGFVMYQLLMGNLSVVDAFEKEVERVSSDPQSMDLSLLRIQVPNDVVSVVEKCLQKTPEAGFPSAAAFKRAVEEAQFATLAQFSDYDAQRLLLDIETETLAGALAGASEEITAHILRNVRYEVADSIRGKMTGKKPTQDATHRARLAIVATATRLLSEERIHFRAAG